MVSKVHTVQLIALLALQLSACQTQVNTVMAPVDITAITAATETEPTCKKIIFSHRIHAYNGFEGAIYSICPDGSDLQRISLDAYDNSKPAWSPDGSQIAYNSRRNEIPELYMMDADGGNVRQITFGFNPSSSNWFWLPDGNRIAIYTQTLEGEQYWQAVDVLTNEFSPLPGWSGEAFFQFPAFSHDGTQMAYMTYSEHVEDVRRTSMIHVQNIDGSDAYTLISEIWSNSTIIWSPDDSQIAFLLLDMPDSNDLIPRADDQFGLYIVNLDGSNLQRVTERTFGRTNHFLWSPDGQSFLIDDYFSLYVLDIQNGTRIELFSLTEPNYFFGVSWQP